MENISKHLAFLKICIFSYRLFVISYLWGNYESCIKIKKFNYNPEKFNYNPGKIDDNQDIYGNIDLWEEDSHIVL